MKPTHLDLFSGIGGFALAAQWAGFETVGFSEIEPYACKVLNERFPRVPNIGDVRQLANFAHLAGRITVLTGGFPCQPWSEAGQRRGKEDPRHLWPAMCDLIKTLRPSWVLGENVSGIIDLGLDDVLIDLENAGYATQPFNVPAVAVDAHHLRERVWIVAYADSRRRRSDSSAGHHSNRENSRGEKADGVLGALRDERGAGTMADAASARLSHTQGLCSDGVSTGYRTTECGGPQDGGYGEWPAEPTIRRVVDGIPPRSHAAKIIECRLKGLGNAIVPQVAEVFLRYIAQIEASANAKSL